MLQIVTDLLWISQHRSIFALQNDKTNRYEEVDFYKRYFCSYYIICM